MSERRILWYLIVLSAALAGGCSRGNAVPKGVPSSPPTTRAPEQNAPPPPPTDPEPAPGEAVRLTLPADGGTWPWSVGRTEDSAGESQIIRFYSIPAFSITGMAVRPEVNRALVSFKSEKKGQPIATRFVLCDTANGRALSEWMVPGQQAVLDLSPDGRGFLSSYSQPAGRDRTVLRLWLIGSDGQLRRMVWNAHTPRPEGVRQDSGDRPDSADAVTIRWAAFAGNDRVVSSSRLGQLRVFDTESGKPLYSLEGSPGRPAITPDGSKVAVFTGNAVTLVDPVAGKVIGTRWVGQLPPHPVLAFSPDGTRLAIGGNGKVLVLSLATGDIQSAILPKLHVTDTGMYDKPFGWVSNRYLWADGRLHDLRFPAPVWEYTGVEQIQLQAGRVWACCQSTGSSTVTLGSYFLPQTRAIARLTAASGRPGIYSLAAGDGVKIDVTGVPDDHKVEAQTALEQRLRALGYRPDPAAPAVLFASVDLEGNKAATLYTGYEPLYYTRRPAQLRLTANGKEIWSENWAIEPPFTVRVAPGATLSDHFKPVPFGQPDYKLFAAAPLPLAFPSPSASGSPLGTCELKEEKLKGWLAW